MHLTDASVVLRQRSAWEAVDLGLLLARKHSALLLISQALVTLPVFALISLCLWQHPAYAYLLFWWLKPLYERLPLYILSRALFGQTPRLKEALRALPKLLGQQFFASLLWRRLSLWRSFAQPVVQLEGLQGKARRERLRILGQKDSATASGLTLIGVHIELLLWLGLCLLAFLLLPQQLWTLDDLLNINNWILSDEESRLHYHLSNLAYALVLVFWQPIYAACGFTLYLNRRTHLEGWDIELKFRALRQRKTVNPLLLLVPVLLAASLALPSPALAQGEELGPDKERLLQQSLTSKAAQDEIKTLLDAPPFTNRKTQTEWQWDNKASLISVIKAWFSWLFFLHDLAQWIQIVLWSVVISLFALLAWRWRHWLATFFQPRHLRKKAKVAPPAVLFGLEVTPESLPEDLLAAVRGLWDHKPREALGLFYRGLLSRLLHQFNLPLTSAHTEGEVLALARSLQQSELTDFCTQLTDCWQRTAYGHELPGASLKEPLCQSWQALFEGQAA
ncbi:hypothetical protein AXE65_05555 [Ventosimonas gracilis]|uniref:Protein-glutamine gamma-glutamyltransferase-like C-terminal domain-containing protein n=1 Tax=Ventosimonas gracilis TaxID=1680762 RepID=A0A139SNH6_9GAMM|nr:DUF4129 domain-containing protein [Ventosimonas gracilis]KXU36119.1 hypothetical protein AXE65_05555 [Ventosimonas gracilis]